MSGKEVTSVQEIDVSAARRIAAGHKAEGNSLVTVLQDVQDEYDYLPQAVLEAVAEEMEVPFAIPVSARGPPLTPEGNR